MKKSQDIEYTGTLPVTLTAIDSYLDSYEIAGNMVQNGTPTQDNPIVPQECGELVSSGEHAGEYSLSFTSDNITTNIYLAEPLRKMLTYADTVNSNDAATRYVQRKIFDGTENFDVVGSGNNTYFRYSLGDVSVQDKNSATMSTHYIYRGITTSNSYVGVRAFVSSVGAVIAIRPDNVSTLTVADFKSWLAAQYANGTPVTVWYILSTPVTESITVPQIPVSGETTIDYDGTLAPSQFELSVYGWVDMPYQMRSNNQWVDREEKKRVNGEWV